MRAKERSDLRNLIAAAIKAGSRNNIVEAKRCIDLLDELKSLTLCSKDLLLSTSIIDLEILRKHRNLLVRKQVHVLIESWKKILYTRKDTVTKAGPKIKQGPALTIGNEHVKLKKPLLNKEEDSRPETHQKEDHMIRLIQKKKTVTDSSRNPKCVDFMSKTKPKEMKKNVMKVAGNLKLLLNKEEDHKPINHMKRKADYFMDSIQKKNTTKVAKNQKFYLNKEEDHKSINDRKRKADDFMDSNQKKKTIKVAENQKFYLNKEEDHKPINHRKRKDDDLMDSIENKNTTEIAENQKFHLNKEEDDKPNNHRKRKSEDLMDSIQNKKAFKVVGAQKIRFDSIRDCSENFTYANMKNKAKIVVKENDVKVGVNGKMCSESSENPKCTILMKTEAKEVKNKLMRIRKKIVFSDDEESD